MKRLICFLVLVTGTVRSTAQWSNDPTVNNAICTAAWDQVSPSIVSDGAGGAIITWEDRTQIGNRNIYAQRINSSGVVQWATNGVAICAAAESQYLPKIVSDGVGGAIIAWHDERNGISNSNIYAQRINSSGVVQWATNGVAICVATADQRFPTIVSDDAGGAIIAWHDVRSATSYDIYAQRVNSSGVVQWTTNGVAISMATQNQLYPTVVGDGAGGAIITWYDFRGGTDYDIYTQRINSSGVIQWTTNGVVICAANGNQESPTIVSDGAGGAIVTWWDPRNATTNNDIYAQRINSSGVVQWTADGIAICATVGDQRFPTLVSDDAGGAIITWHDIRSGVSYDIYAQRINASGAIQWTTNGVAICTAVSDQGYPTIVSNGAGGALITWHDFRGGITTDPNIYAQRIDSSGVVQWTANGVAISTAPRYQIYPTLVSDGGGRLLHGMTPVAATTTISMRSEYEVTGCLAQHPLCPHKL